MKIRYVVALMAGLSLGVVSAGAQTSPGASQLTSTPMRIIITPIDSRLTLPATDPRRQRGCRSMPSEHCAPQLLWGGNGNGGLPTVDPVFQGDVPHVLVSFVLQKIEVTGSAPFEPHQIDWPLIWDTHSPAASQENSHAGYWIEGAEELDENGYFHNPLLIYSALILDACDSFSSFPVTHETHVEHSELQDHLFSATDNTTLDATGFYTFDYTFRVETNYPIRVPNYYSDVHLSGKVNVTCTSLAELPPLPKF